VRRRSEERLLHAVTQAVARDGYANLTVRTVLDLAAVSRATFYQYFSSIEDCFRSAYRLHADELLAEIRLAAQSVEQREFAMLDVLVDTAVARPHVARLLLTEGLAAGPLGLQQRDALIGSIADVIADPGSQTSSLDLSYALLIGGSFRFLSMCLSDDTIRPELRNELRDWASTFTRRPSQPLWTARLAPSWSVGRRRPFTLDGFKPVGPPRKRILHAIAATVRHKGYRDLTVADIVSAARVSRRSFYNHFASKADAFTSAYEYGFEQAITVCAPAFFARKVWPERVWHAAQAFSRFLSREPLIAYLGFVECYAVGPRFAGRVHDTQLAFTLFLEEGYRQRPQAPALSRACSALTASTIFEAGFQGLRREAGLHIRGLQPLAVYIALAPFIGRV